MIKIKPCSTVGNAFMVIKENKYGKMTKLAIGLTKFEAECERKKLINKSKN